MIPREYIPYIYKLRTKNERQLKIMLDSLEKEKCTYIEIENTKYWGFREVPSRESQKIKKGEK